MMLMNLQQQMSLPYKLTFFPDQGPKLIPGHMAIPPSMMQSKRPADLHQACNGQSYVMG